MSICQEICYFLPIMEIFNKYSFDYTICFLILESCELRALTLKPSFYRRYKTDI